MTKYHAFLRSNKYKLLAAPASMAMLACMSTPTASEGLLGAVYWAVFFSAAAAFLFTPWELTEWSRLCYRDLCICAKLRGFKVVSSSWGGHLAVYEFLSPKGQIVRLKIQELLEQPKR